MVIRIRLRATDDRQKITIGTDWKDESRDTPALQRVGLAIIRAIEGCAENANADKESAK